MNIILLMKKLSQFNKRGIKDIMILGYEIEAWDEIYKLYRHENKLEPQDLFELLIYWRSKPKDTPDDCVKITAMSAEAQKVDVAPVREMIHNILLRMTG